MTHPTASQPPTATAPQPGLGALFAALPPSLQPLLLIVALVLGAMGLLRSDGLDVLALPPHPATVARLDALDKRIDAIERTLPESRSEAALLGAQIAGLKEQLALFLSRDTRILTEPKRR